jgi:hypothetical protein
VRPVLQVGELSVGGGQRRGEVGGLTAGFAADGAGISSRVDPLHVLVPPVFRERSASPKSSLTSIVRCRPPAHHQPALFSQTAYDLVPDQAERS